MVTVTLSAKAEQQVADLPYAIERRVQKLLKRLEKWPEVSGAKALSGNLAGSHRLRTGDYRVQFRLEGDRILVEKIGHRAKFYEK